MQATVKQYFNDFEYDVYRNVGEVLTRTPERMAELFFAGVMENPVFVDAAEETAYNTKLQELKDKKAAELAASKYYTHPETHPKTIVEGLPEVMEKAGTVLFENKYRLADFYKNLYAYSLTPASTYIGIAAYGDSVGNGVAMQFAKGLFASYPEASRLYPVSSQPNQYAVGTLTGTYFNSGGVPVDQTVYDGAGETVADFTYLPSGDHIVLKDAATLLITPGEATGWATAKVFFAKGVGFGSALVELLDKGTTTVRQTATINLADTALGGTKVEFTLDKSKKYDVKITATGNVVFLKGGFFKPNGIVPVCFHRGSSTLQQNNYANQTIFAYLLSEFNVSLMFMCVKEENHLVSLPETMTLLANYPSVSKLVVGSLPDSAGGNYATDINKVTRQEALKSDFSYFDGHKACKNYDEMVRLGWMLDNTHPNDQGNSYVASLIIGELAAMGWLGTVEKRAINHDGTSNHVATNKLSILSTDKSVGEVDVFEQLGFAPSYVGIKNVARFSLSGGQRIEPYSTDSTHFKTSTGADGFSRGAGASLIPVTVANLGYATVGTIRYASNGRKAGEVAGAGTGCPVYKGGTANTDWYTFYDNTLVQA